MTLSEIALPAFLRSLQTLEALLVKGEVHASARGFDVMVLLEARLAPDQHPLARQVTLVCDTVQRATALLSGAADPSVDADLRDLAGLRARIASVRAFVEAQDPALIDAGESRRISLPYWDGLWLSGRDAVLRFALPNLYFHLSTAYALLRHNGVPLGKADFLGDLPLQQP
jgi:hypothetical protein